MRRFYEKKVKCFALLYTKGLVSRTERKAAQRAGQVLMVSLLQLWGGDGMGRGEFDPLQSFVIKCRRMSRLIWRGYSNNSIKRWPLNALHLWERDSARRYTMTHSAAALFTEQEAALSGQQSLPPRVLLCGPRGSGRDSPTN